MPSNTKIGVLLIEDDPNDADLITRELRRGGLHNNIRRVDNREDFLRALAEETPDIILSDHGLPQFDGFSAMALAQEKCGHVPLLFVTGLLGEEVIIETLTRGATDYVLKNHLSKLLPAVERALREAEERRKRREAEAEREQLIVELRDALGRVKTLSGLLPICSSCKKIRDDKGYWNRLETYLQEHSGATLTHGICPDCAKRLYPGLLDDRADRPPA
jgi:DNA-binding NtrC family response regulator